MAMDGDNQPAGQSNSYASVPTISTVAGFDQDANLVAQTQTVGAQTRSFGAKLNPADWPQQATNDGLGSSAAGTGMGTLRRGALSWKRFP